MKKIILLSTVLFAQFSHAGWEDFVKKGISAIGGRVNCNANYSDVKSGVFGPKQSNFQELIKADSVSQACEIAKSKDSRSSGVFGESSKSLTGLSCTNEKKISFQVNVETCEIKL